jgi:hypothetical protein
MSDGMPSPGAADPGPQIAPPGTLGAVDGRWDWLPRWLRPGTERTEGARGPRRRVELVVLVAVGALLAVATIGDLLRQVHLNQRFARDEHTFYAYTGYHPKSMSIWPGTNSTRDIACALPHRRTHINLCLVLTGPAGAQPRTIAGGFRLPFKHADRKLYRYGCFGLAAERQWCGASGPPPGIS